jgi:ornithine carbamoyltransferase
VYTFVGTANNISRSWMDIARVMDLKFNHICTSGNEIGNRNLNYQFSTKLELTGSDVVLTDSLPSQCLNNDYISKYQITLDRMKLTNKGALFNPCPPFFRNEEVSDEVLCSEYFVGYAFKKNLIYVQQAVLIYCLGLKVL